MDHAIVNLADLIEVNVSLLQKPRSRVESARHPLGQQCQSLRFGWQGVSLAVVDHLQPVFELPQKLIGGSQAAVFSAGEKAFVLQAGERQHGAAVANPSVGAAVEALQALHQKFDIADAAALQLYFDSVGAM